MTGRCLFGFSGEKPFLLPDNEGVKMNTSPVRMDDLPLNRFHCRIAALTFGAHLTDGYVLGVIGYAISATVVVWIRRTANGRCHTPGSRDNQRVSHLPV